MKLLNIFTLFVGLHISLLTFSQAVILEKEIELSKSFLSGFEDTYCANNLNDGSYELIVLNKDSLNILDFTNQDQFISQHVISRPKLKHDFLLGHSRDNGNLNIFFIGNKRHGIVMHSYNKIKGLTESKAFGFENKDEYFLKSFSEDTAIYICTVKKFSSILKIYKFTGNNMSAIDKYDFSDHDFYHLDFTKLFDVLNVSPVPFKFELGIEKMDNTIPCPLKSTSKMNKIYCDNGKIIITLDLSKEKTELIFIDLQSKTSQVLEFNKPEIGKNSYHNKSNSFYSNNHLYQLIASKDELLLQIFNIQSKTLFKTFNATDESEIAFSNTKFMHEGHSPNSLFYNYWDKEIDNSKKAIKKIYDCRIGVSAYILDSLVQLTIGGYAESQSSNEANLTMGGVTTISTTKGTITKTPKYSSNMALVNYNTSLSTRQVFFKSQLGLKNLEHIEGQISRNGFDKITEFKRSMLELPDDYTLEDILFPEIQDDFISEVIFKNNEKYIYGYYSTKENKYYLREFKEK